MKKLEDYVRSIPDFPEPGIIFRDITTVLKDADGLTLAIDSMQEMLKDVDFDVVLGPDSRGFIFGTPIAYNLHEAFVPVRNKGKLPKDAILPGQKVVIIDDLIATGGTTEAIIKLVESMGAKVVKCCFLIELAGLKGRDKLKGYAVDSAIIYEGNYKKE